MAHLTRFHCTGLDDSLVKKWLLLQAYGAERPNEPVQVQVQGLDRDKVLCTVTRSYFKPTRLHTLSIQATVSVDISCCPHVRTSPSTILDTFTGDCNDAMAPGWLCSLDISVFFPHDRAGFIGLFVNLAMWAENLEVAGTWAQFKQLDPSTPHKRTTPNNVKPVRPSTPLTHCDGSDSEDDSPVASWDDVDASYELERLPALKSGDSVDRWTLSRKLVPCLCPECEGKLIAYSVRQHHEARELRQRSTSTTYIPTLTPTPSIPPSVLVPPTFASFISPPETAATAAYHAPPPDDSLLFTTISEAAGLSHLQRVEASGEIFTPISVDDWELLNGSHLPDEESTDGPAPPADENDPDPFYITPKAAQHLPTAREVHPNPAVYIIYVVVLWLHSQFHLPFRACNALLAVLALAFKAAGAPINPLCVPPFQPSSPTSELNPISRSYRYFLTKSLAEQLATLLSVEGVEAEIEKSIGKAKARVPGVWKNIFDGKVCQELPTADGSWFFFPTEEEVASGELRIGVTMGLTGKVLLSCYNQLADCLIPYGQPFMGGNYARAERSKSRSMPTVSSPTRQRITSSLAAWSNDSDPKASPEAFKENGFRERTDAEHRRLQKEYLKCNTKAARDAFVKKYATRWCELHRLPYFNICEMIVIDPMHNLFLGVVKTHFYHIWVQLNVLRKTKELRTLHALLSKLKLPAHLGRLPSLIGEPTGGSLTADQWLVFCTIVAPLIIPQLWQEYIPEESPQELAQRRAREIAAILEAKRTAAAAARQAPPAQAGKRVRKPTAKAALGQGAREPVGSELREAVEIMYHATADDRGTVQALARDLDTAQEDGGIDFQLSTRAEKGQLSPELYFCILRHLQIRLPNVKLHSFVEHAPSSNSLMLEPHGILFNDVIVRRSRYLASSRSPHPYTSLIAVRTSAANDAQTWVGELRSIVAIEQPGTKSVHRFGFVRWFRPTTTELGSTVWSQFFPLNVQIWDADTYLDSTNYGPDALINLEDIVTHVARMNVTIRGQTYWATIPTRK
ncbi:hypothetical protein B0H13DRAFT_1924870 [Mycena leptocephala]|nr:hypothetical protein B0H13DRAFT_1924870 [Mycena leptocephala]